MPTYVYKCPVCGESVERVLPAIPDRVSGRVRCICGRWARRDWTAAGMPRADAFRPYVTDNMGHEPVEVTSRAHEARLCRERNLERIT